MIKKLKTDKKILKILTQKKIKINLSCWIYEDFIQKFYQKISRKNN